MTLPDRNFDRWHLPIDTSEYQRVTVCDIRTRKIQRSYVPVWCERHTFRRVGDCMWSWSMGAGYPNRFSGRATATHWWYMARLNRRMRKK